MPRRSPSTRIEKDSLGEIAVPAAAYYGAQTARAVENYPISGLRAHPFLIRAYGLLKLACAEANLELKMIPPRIGRAIVRAAHDVAAGKLNEQFLVDVYQAGAGVSFHMNVNEVIANRAIEYLGGKRGEYSIVHPNDHVNFGQSTNDTFPTAMRLAALRLLEELYPSLAELEGAFRKKSRQFDAVLKSGRTHLQDAVPIRLGQEFAAYAATLGEARVQLVASARSLGELGIG